MQGYVTFANETKESLLMYAVSLIILVCASGSKHFVGPTAGTILFACSIVGFIVVSLTFSSKFAKFLAQHGTSLPDPSYSLVYPNVAFACALCLFSFLLVVYGAYRVLV